MKQASGLHRYWIKLAPPAPVGFTLGCGVTALSEEDARALVWDQLRESPRPIVAIESDVDVSRLDADHIIPNMGDCTQRGIWYPNLGIRPPSP